MSLKKLFPIPEAAEQFRVSTFTIQAWLSKGRLRRTKVGRRTMITESELERFITENNQVQTSVDEEIVISRGEGEIVNSEARSSFVEIKREFEELMARWHGPGQDATTP